MIKNIFYSIYREFRFNLFYSITSLAGLSLAIAVALIIFIILKIELTHDSYNKNYQNIYRLVETRDSHCFTPAKLGPWVMENFSEFQSFSRIINKELFLSNGSEFRLIKRNFYVDSTFFQIFDFDVILGSDQIDFRDKYSIILTESFSKMLFGDEYPIGKTLMSDGNQELIVKQVIKDLPPTSSIQIHSIIPIEALEVLWNPNSNYNIFVEEGNWSFQSWFLLKDDVDIIELNRKISEDLRSRFGRNSDFQLQSFKEVYFDLFTKDIGIEHGNFSNSVILMAIALLVLAIACINYINITTARAIKKSKQIGIRKVHGALQKHIFLQVVIESIFFLYVSFILALPLSFLSINYVVQDAGILITSDLIFEAKNLMVFVFLTGIIGVMTGIYPGYYLSKLFPFSTKVKTDVSKSGAIIARRVLLSVQIISSVLLIFATMMINNQLEYIKNMDLGFEKENIVIVRLNDEIARNIERFKNSLRSESKILKISCGMGYPSYIPNGMSVNIREKNVSMPYIIGDPDYVSTLGLDIVEGRDFSWNNNDFGNSIILNKAAVNLLDLQNPIGNYVWGLQITGIVNDFHHNSLHSSIGPLAIVCSYIKNRSIIIKIDGQNVSNTLDIIEKHYTSVCSVYPFEYFFLDDMVNEQYKREAIFNRIIMYFSVLTLVITCIGLISLLTYFAEIKESEIGIRKVLGANLGQVIYIIINEFLFISIISFILAFPFSYYGLLEWLKNFAFSIKYSFLIYLNSCLIIFSILIISVSGLTIHAANKNPVNTIRRE